jgi:hypothetical protein
MEEMLHEQLVEKMQYVEENYVVRVSRYSLDEQQDLTKSMKMRMTMLEVE